MSFVECWVCNSADTVPWKRRSIDRPLSPVDLRITDDRYGSTLALSKCLRCGFIFAVGDELEQITRLYRDLVDEAYEGTQDSRAFQMRWLLQTCLQLAPGARSVLDVGAGAGLLVAEARRLGLDATGIEPSAALVAAAKRLHDVKLIRGVLPNEEIAGRKFDLVFLVDVIEHVADPVTLLGQCAQHIEADGVLIVVTPDAGSAAARLLGQRWWHWRLAHVGYFGARSFRVASQKAGLRVITAMRPRWFFRFTYLADRLARYLPIEAVNTRLSRLPVFDRLYATIVPLNLRDSMLFALRPDPCP